MNNNSIFAFKYLKTFNYSFLKKKNMKKIFILMAIAALGACNTNASSEIETSVQNSDVTAPAETPKTVVDIAIGSADHTTLVTAVKAAGLVETLSGDGPFTVFAPVNAAFNNLPAGTLDNLLKTENKSALAGVLTYHVVAGKVMAADLKDGQMIKTVNGQELKVTIKDGKVMINDALVTAADLSGSNGVVHVINKVLLPK